MSTLCIVPCGGKKIWDKNPKAGPTEAQYVYIGPYSKKCIEYAKKFYPNSWCILSAKHGFLFPNDIVPEPYNVTFNDKKTNPISTKQLFQQAKAKGLDKFDEIVVLGGKAYVDRVIAVFPNKKIRVPLSHKRIGEKLKSLNDAIKKGILL